MSESTFSYLIEFSDLNNKTPGGYLLVFLCFLACSLCSKTGSFFVLIQADHFPSICLFIQSLPFSPFSLSLPFHVLSRRVSVSLGGFVSPGVNQLPDKQFLDQGRPRVFGVAAVSRDAVGLNHRAALQRVDLRRETHNTEKETTQ